jgi:hypothetical protein
VRQAVAAVLTTHGAALTEYQVSELQALDKVAATNGLAMTLMTRQLPAEEESKGAAADGSSAPKLPSLSTTFDFAHHPAFPTLKVKSAANATSHTKSAAP